MKLLNCARLRSIDDSGVVIVRNTSPTVPDPYVTWAPLLPANIRNPLARPIGVRETEETLAADLVVLATGLAPPRASTKSASAGTSRLRCTTSATRSRSAACSTP